MATLVFSNNASALLAATITTLSTTIQVATGAGALFPAPTATQYFKITLEDAAGNIEICHCTARSSDLLTVTRAQEGTAARAWTASLARVEMRPTAGMMATFAQTTNSLPAIASSTDNAIARWDLTTGTAIQNSTGLLDDSGNATLNSVTGAYQEFTSGGATASVRRESWDSTLETLTLGLNATTNLKIGQMEVIRVRNNSGGTLTRGQVVYINGSNSFRPTIVLSKADARVTADKTLGILNDTLAASAEGFVIVQGMIESVNTAAFADGDALWLSAATAGAFTNVVPTQPNHAVFIGYCTRAHATLGTIMVKVQNGYELQELHNVLLTTPADTDALMYDNATSLWKNSQTFRDIPQNSQTTAYPLVASDRGKHISITTGGITVPAGVFTTGQAVTIFNDSTASQTITTSAVTAYLPGTAAAKTSFALAARGCCTILCLGSNKFVISGGGLS